MHGVKLAMKGFQLEDEYFTDALTQLDQRALTIRSLMEQSSQEDRNELWDQLDISSIYHDCALEGHVLSVEELNAAFDPTQITDAANFQLYTSLRNHKNAYDYVRQLAAADDLNFDIELLNRFHEFFVSRRDDPKTIGFRQDIPLHRLYFHEIVESGNIKNGLNSLIDSMNEPEDLETPHPVIWATYFHYHFMHIFPYNETSGKVGRAIMNLILIKYGFLPAVIHATERQRYYEILKQPQRWLTQFIIDSVNASFDAAVRFLARSTHADKKS